MGETAAVTSNAEIDVNSPRGHARLTDEYVRLRHWHTDCYDPRLPAQDADPQATSHLRIPTKGSTNRSPRPVYLSLDEERSTALAFCSANSQNYLAISVRNIGDCDIDLIESHLHHA
jgi:hypothetical protein